MFAIPLFRLHLFARVDLDLLHAARIGFQHFEFDAAWMAVSASRLTTTTEIFLPFNVGRDRLDKNLLPSTDMDPNISAAFIGAAVSTAAMIVGEFVSPFFRKRQEKKAATISSYEQYAYPLATATCNLFFRLREILVSERSEFLLSTSAQTTYNQYKYISTVYRLCAFLGWVRALRLERSLILRSESATDSAIQRAIDAIEKAFADGPHVEMEVLEGLARVWDLRLPEEPRRTELLASKLDAFLHHEQGVECPGVDIRFSHLAKTKQLDIIKKASRFLADSIPCEQPSEAFIVETLDEATDILDVVQTWIYRDWQSAVGDAMLTRSNDIERRFDVIGYAMFEDQFRNKNKWFLEVEQIIQDLRPTAKRASDYRTKQLTQIMRASAELICALSKLDIPARPVPADVAKQAALMLE